MQVSQVQDHITHAVIGGKQAIEFGISDSPEFFNILSSTLYKDQILAVVREVLCNAWDSHIEAGCISKPVEIELTDSFFLIKDFGKGIHADDMGLIYGTYGNSTKKNDGKQTGGFGLGCKAPFAYTDHFEVISSHDGVRTIYNLSKSSSQAMGKPGITPIASFPTTDTGLSVKIPIQAKDRQRFHQLIRRIASNGDMKMDLNHSRIPPLGFNTDESNFLILPNQTRVLESLTRMMVRYGNVIYPVDSHQEIDSNYKAVIDLLNKLKGSMGNDVAIIFQAPPHSISVTPSRESLSMQGHTVKTLNKLMEDFLAEKEAKLDKLCDIVYEQHRIQAVKNKRMSSLLSRDAVHMPPVFRTTGIEKISDFNVLARFYAPFNYPSQIEYLKKDLTERLNLMASEKLVDRGLVQTFLRDLANVKTKYENVRYYRHYSSTEDNNWLQKQVIRPLIGKLIKAGLDVGGLYVCDASDINAENNRKDKAPPLVLASKAKPMHLFACLPYLRNIVVLTTRRDNLVERARHHDAFEELGSGQGYMVYVTGRKAKDKEDALKLFQGTNMRVVDMTVRQDWEDEPAIAADRIKRVAQPGIACIAGAASGVLSVDLHKLAQKTAVRTKNPEFVAKISYAMDALRNRFDNWTEITSRTIIDLFGSKGGVVVSEVSMEKWTKAGAVDLDEYVVKKVCEYLTVNPRIQQYMAFSYDRASTKLSSKGVWFSDSVLKLCFTNEMLMTEFKLIDPLLPEDKLYLALWRDLINSHYLRNDEAAKVHTVLQAIPLAPEVEALLKKLADNKMLAIISPVELGSILRKPDPIQAKKAFDVLVNLING